MNAFDVVVVGGGLAGLTTSIGLSKKGLSVCLIEKNNYPLHKVCGEMISNEVLPFLQSIDCDPSPLNPQRIKRFLLSSPSGRSIETKLPQGAFSVSRFTLDHFLHKKAIAGGVESKLESTVEKIQFSKDKFEISLFGGEKIESTVVVGAYGKRSNLDRTLKRKFFTQRSPYIGVKYHAHYDMPTDIVHLHNFHQGYCGVSKVENDAVNICYLSTRENLKTHKTIEQLEKQELYKNPYLKEVFQHSEFLFKAPKVINEISFAPKSPVENHVLMAGDAAGLIAPLSGNGMAMAIHSAYLLIDSITQFFDRNIDRNGLEKRYQEKWNATFKKRLFYGRKFQSLFGEKVVSEIGLLGLKAAPFILPKMIQKTSGKPFFESA